MTLTKCFDAAFPPAEVPAGCGAVLGYIGTVGPDRLDRAEHVWAPRQWLPFAGLRQFPCWVTDFSKDPVASANQAVVLARALGWRPLYRRALVYDTEALVDRAWCQRFEHTVDTHLFVPVNYGSASVVAQNGSSRLWLAKWDGDPQLEGGQSVEAHQYAAGVIIPGGLADFSSIGPDLIRHGAQGPRIV